MLPLVFGGIAALTVAAWNKARKVEKASLYGKLTPTRKYILMRALDGKLTSDKYKELAKGFDDNGLPEEAELLRKRASLNEMSPEQKKALNDLAKKALASDKPDGIQSVSDYMMSIGAVGTATKLANHAKAVASAAAIPVIPPAAHPPQEPEPEPTHEAASQEGALPAGQPQPMVEQPGSTAAAIAAMQAKATAEAEPATAPETPKAKSST
jgi:hypothetical protein